MTTVEQRLRHLSDQSATALIVVELPLAIMLLRIVIERPSVYFWGDEAILDLEARQAAGGHDLLGPYSRFGWHHPGPVWLMLIGWVRALAGGTTLGTVYGVLLVHAFFAAMVVLTARRLGGATGGLVVALLTAAWYSSFGFERLAYVWNPWAIALPALLLVLLCAHAVTTTRRAGPALLAALLCGSFLVQTHLGTLLLVAALLVMAAGLRTFVIRRRLVVVDARQRTAATKALVLLGMAGLVLAWLPPAVEQLTNSPGNVTLLARYAGKPHARHDIGTGIKVMGAELGAFPFGHDIRDAGESIAGAYAGSGPACGAWFAAYLAVTTLVAIFAWRRRRYQIAVLATAALLSLIVATASAVVVDGPLFPYLVSWMSVLVIPALLAGALLVIDAFPRTSESPVGRHQKILPAMPLLAAAAVALSVASGVATDRQLVQHIGFSGATNAWRAAQLAVAGHPGVVGIVMSDPDVMPAGAAIADQLVRHGRAYSVNQPFLYVFGARSKSHGDETIELDLLSRRSPPPPAGASLLATIAGTRLYARTLRSGAAGVGLSP